MKFTCSNEGHRVGGRCREQDRQRAHDGTDPLERVAHRPKASKIGVRATDLELTLEQAFPAEISETGAVTVPAKLFCGYLGNLPAGMLELTGTPTRASVKCERSNYDFLALPAG